MELQEQTKERVSSPPVSTPRRDEEPGPEEAAGSSCLGVMKGGKSPRPEGKRRWFLKQSEAFYFNDFYLFKRSPADFPTESAPHD